MIRAAVTLVFLLSSLMSFTQVNDNRELSQLHYSDAIKDAKKTIKKDPENLSARHTLAIAYGKTGLYDESFAEYLHLISADYKDFSAEDWNNIAQYSLSQGMTDLSDIAFSKLEEVAPTILTQQHPSINGYFKPFNLTSLNSEFNEFSPVFYNEQIVFTSDRPSSAYDLSKNDWTSTSYLSVFRMDTITGKIKPFGDQLNEEGHNGPISFSKSEETVYITHAFKEDKNTINNSRIVVANWNSKNWKQKELFEFGSDKEYSFAHPVFLESLNMLVFSSNKEGGKGNMDLYFSKNVNGTWQEPVNISSINTPFNEVFPCKDNDDPNSLYFSSNGYKGYGGLDIYKTTYNNGKWSKPELLPKAINSNFDDFGVVFTDENSGYVSSNRPGGKGGDDIFQFIRSDKFILEGYLVDDQDYLPIPLQKVYIVDDNNYIIDSVFSNDEGFFTYNRLPYQSIGLMPSSEDGQEMIIRPKSENIIKDPLTSIYLMTSKGFVDDSIALDQPEVVTYILTGYKGKKSRCVVYENGDKAVSIIFTVKDKDGKIIDKIQTGKNGCFKLEKLYPDDSYLELSEEFVALQMRIVDPTEEEKTNWQEETTDIRIISNKKCVEYEDGTPAINVAFAVKDSTGKIVDKIVTNQNGCFNVRKLYDENSYLELLEENLVGLGMKLMPPYDDEKFEWLKSDDLIILKYGRKCMVFKNGGHPTNAKYIVKDEDGNVIDGSLTDKEGCLKVKKLVADNSYSVYVLDEEGLTYKAKMDTNRHSYLILDRTEMDTDEFEFVTITVKRCVEYEDGSKAVQVKFAVISESDQLEDRFITDHNGCFTMHKLYDNTTLVIDDEELLSMGMRFKDPTAAEDGWYYQEDRIILTFAEKCLTYENGQKASNAKYQIKKGDQEVIESSFTDENGCLKMKKLYLNGEYHIELLDEEGMTIRIPLEPVTSEKVVFDNIYFEFGKYDLTPDSKEVLKDLAEKMKTQPNLKVVVNAHTDARGSEKINQNLSEKRANSVANYLSNMGISKDRIQTHGYGESNLINGCDDNSDCSDEEHSKNRRIEFEFSWN